MAPRCNETALLNNTFVVKQQYFPVMRLTKEVARGGRGGVGGEARGGR